MISPNYKGDNWIAFTNGNIVIILQPRGELRHFLVICLIVNSVEE